MSNKKLSLKELFDLCEFKIKLVYKDVIKDFYSEISCEEHKAIKVYQAIDRINMYIATEVVKETFYSYDLNSYLKNRNRKMINKIIDAVEGLKYETVRNKWHESYKELFYKQKEDCKIQQKLERICIIGRVINSEKDGFVRICDGCVTVVQSIADATEFIAISDQNKALEDTRQMILDNTDFTDLKVFFNNKIKGRNTFLYA